MLMLIFYFKKLLSCLSMFYFVLVAFFCHRYDVAVDFIFHIWFPVYKKDITYQPHVDFTSSYFSHRIPWFRMCMKFSEKLKFLTYQGIRNISFLENFAYILNEWSHIILIFKMARSILAKFWDFDQRFSRNIFTPLHLKFKIVIYNCATCNYPLMHAFNKLSEMISVAHLNWGYLFISLISMTLRIWWHSFSSRYFLSWNLFEMSTSTQDMTLKFGHSSLVKGELTI